MKFLRFIIQFIIGLVFAAATVITIIPMFIPLGLDKYLNTVFVLYGIALLLAILIGIAPTARRTFGRGFLILGSAIFALPISAFVFSWSLSSHLVKNTEGTEQAAATVSGIIGTGALTGVAGFLGFIVGGIFLLTGLILSLGGRREVIVIQKPEPMERKEPRF